MKSTHFPRLIFLGLTLLFGMQQLHAYNGPISGPKVTEVSFSGDSYHELTSDDGETTYEAPHWTLAEGTTEPKELPIAYTKDASPKVEMKFKIDFEIPEGETLDVKVKAKGTDDVDLPERTITLVHGQKTYTYEEKEADNPWPDTIKYYGASESAAPPTDPPVLAAPAVNNSLDAIGYTPPSGAFTLSWKFTIQGTEYTDETKNRCYVTAAEPTCTTFSETLFYYACHRPNGLTSNNDAERKSVTHAIWDDFASKKMARVDGDGNLKQEELAFTPQGGEILIDGRGVCGKWAEFFRQVLAVHAFPSDYIDIDTKGGIDLPIVGNQNPVWWVVSEQNVVQGNVAPTDIDWNQGQGGAHTSKDWQAHAIAKAYEEYYDPSYGIGGSGIDTKQKYEARAVSGYRYQPTVQGGNFWVPRQGGDIKRLKYSDD